MFRFILRFLLFYLSHYSGAHHNDNDNDINPITNTQASANMNTHLPKRLLFLGYAMGFHIDCTN